MIETAESKARREPKPLDKSEAEQVKQIAGRAAADKAQKEAAGTAVEKVGGIKAKV